MAAVTMPRFDRPRKAAKTPFRSPRVKDLPAAACIEAGPRLSAGEAP
jgi:hypothetical protein